MMTIATSEHTQTVAAGDADPILQVRNLQTHFFTGEGVVLAVDGASFDVHAGKTLGIVGESGCGKSVAAKSLLQIVDKPGRIVGGEIRYRHANRAGQEQTVNILRLPADSREMKAIRGGEISMIFQEPMSSFSPIHTLGNQLTEAIRLHTDIDKRAARE